jgi:hypothetical protein
VISILDEPEIKIITDLAYRDGNHLKEYKPSNQKQVFSMLIWENNKKITHD